MLDFLITYTAICLLNVQPVVEEIFRSFTSVEILWSQNSPLQVKVLNSDVTQVKAQKYYPQAVLKV